MQLVYKSISFSGSHKTSEGTFKKWGHMKLRTVLSKHMKPIDSSWPVVGQFSSVGSLGKYRDDWMCGELLTSIAKCKGTSSADNLFQKHKLPPLKLVFPSVENVRTSLEGYPAGASIPYSSANKAKQPWFNEYCHQWRAEHAGRSAAAPHIKTYFRMSPFDTNIRLAWFLLTSANMSKAAWGALQKKGSQLAIRSFELGVLFIPSLSSSGEECTDHYFHVSNSAKSNSNKFPIPYTVPLVPYRSKDEPWTWDSPHTHAPDRNGNIWVPGKI